ncbi:heme-binding protein [Chelativorans sp. Marseille-P2723]|uniref:heme-binding protein n=1 Tax=Chelativorans sp. Marseille-P2723 TaxID=2709133 RepID=UPI00156FA82A|nr:heme-binding protein [Chelativorans sp. Marseille-P2723]
MDHNSHKAAIERDEADLARLPLDARTLIDVANRLIVQSPAPLAVKVVLGQRVVAYLADAGTAGDNAAFLDMKINTVMGCGHSSLWWFHHLRSTGRTLADVIWADPRRVTDLGGAVPLFHAGQVVGAIAVSGLPHEDDHALIMRVVRQALDAMGGEV